LYDNNILKKISIEMPPLAECPDPLFKYFIYINDEGKWKNYL